MNRAVIGISAGLFLNVALLARLYFGIHKYSSFWQQTFLASAFISFAVFWIDHLGGTTSLSKVGKQSLQRDPNDATVVVSKFGRCLFYAFIAVQVAYFASILLLTTTTTKANK